MLKIWKQAWKNEERGPGPGQDSEQLSGASSGAPSVDAATAAPPSFGDAILAPALTPDQVGIKRRRSSSDAQSSTVKFSKTEHPTFHSIRDSLGSHLPEVIETAISSGTTSSLSVESFEEQVLFQAQRENTIAVPPPFISVTKLYTQFLSWAIQTERCRPVRTTSRPRHTCVFVVHDDPSIDTYASHLEAGGSFTIGKYTGSVHESEDPWSDMLQKDVVVVVSNLLLDSLLRGTLAITQLHAVIISDAQNIKNQDSHPIIPIVRVMNDFYRITDSLSRPRIFAVVTAPKRFHFDITMLKLENTLDAKVFGISGDKRERILALPDRPSEIVVVFDAPLRIAETKLYRQLHQLDRSEALFRPHFRAARYTLAEVGACASDLVWRRALKEIEASVAPSYDEEGEDDSQTSLDLKAKSDIHAIVKNWAFTMPNLDFNSRGFNVTPKFFKLVEILQSCEPYGEAFRGIVFVRRRATALAITDLLRTLDDCVGFLRPYAMIGPGPAADPMHQQEIFRGFATGTYNLLIASKSSEDLDIPKASIVIRFDIFESQVSYAYVRARTRGRESHLVHMVERGNDVHRRMVSQITQLDNDMLHWTETICNDPRSSVPPRTLHESVNPYHSDSEDGDEKVEFIRDPTTSGRINLQDATTVIYRFASSLKRVDGDVNQPLFHFEEEDVDAGRSFVCTIILPGSPIHNISGLASFSMAHARRSACFQACMNLSVGGLLDYRLFPLPSNTAQHFQGHGAKEKAGLSLQVANLDTKTSSHYYPRKKPDFWPNTISPGIQSLYPTIISTDYSAKASQPYAPIVILTRQPLPTLAAFKLFFSGVPAVVRFRQGAAFKVEEARLHDIYLYTVRLCQAITNKPFVCPLANMPYLYAPLGLTWKDIPETWSDPSELPNIVDHIPWPLVSLAAQTGLVGLRSENLETIMADVEDAVIQDRWVEFTRRYDAIRIRPDLTPLSKPVDSPREAAYENLVEYCKARRKGFEGLQDYEQPLIEVSKVPAVLNHLNPTSRPLTAPSKSPAKYLIPELCAKFTIPASTLRTALLLPSVTQRIDDFLMVKELNAKLFDHAISEHLLHVAISAPSASIEYNYERLELLGDAFLKYLSSVYVFVTNPAQNEGALHVARQRIISNKSLLQNANRVGLPQFIQAKPFTFKFWQPPTVYNAPSSTRVIPDETGQQSSMDLDISTKAETLQFEAQNSSTGEREGASGAAAGIEIQDVDIDTEIRKPKHRKRKHHDEQNTQSLGDKAVADVAEAIIGAAYISGGREIALKATKALNIPVPNVDRWSDFSRKVLAPPPDVTAKLRPGSIEAVEAIIGHKFNRPHLLAQALTHASIQGYESTSYERLEFVGDAIVDFMVIRHIFDRDGRLSPGGLTLLKGAMVSNSALAAVCVWSGLHQYLLSESYQLASSIQIYVDKLKYKQIEEYKLAEKEGRSPGQYWLEIEPPKTLSDVVESIVGAIYISDDFSPVGAEAVFDNVLKPFYDRHITLKTLSHHPTKVLCELFQAHGCQQFEITREKEEDVIRCAVVVHDIVLASATDTTATSAARRASFSALDALEGDAMFMARTCDCRTNNQARKGQKQVLDQVIPAFRDEEENVLTVEAKGENATIRKGDTVMVE